jgi:AmmeMemoRadiSam system protein B
VPHAGWVFSGATALAVLEALKDRRSPKTFVLFGAVHRAIRRSAIFSNGVWRTPLGDAEVDERLAREILARADDLLADDPRAHEEEHSIEVQVPFLQHLFPDAKIVPIAVVPGEDAPEIGRRVARTIRNLDADAVCLGSTDLTHYGPAYGFAPKGVGEAALRWVRDENDRRIMDLMLRLDAEGAVPEAESRLNACGSGAVAATLAAARELGAVQGYLVHYTTSFDVMRERMGRRGFDAAVGYAGLLF